MMATENVYQARRMSFWDRMNMYPIAEKIAAAELSKAAQFFGVSRQEMASGSQADVEGQAARTMYFRRAWLRGVPPSVAANVIGTTARTARRAYARFNARLKVTERREATP